MVAILASHVTWFLLISAALTGCFYTDPINQRPSIDIHQAQPGEAIHRGSVVGFEAIADDPDHDAVAVTWRAYACTGTDCDPVEFDDGADTSFTTKVTDQRTTGGVFDTLHIELEARDVHGATARPKQTLDLNVVDAAPTLALRKEARSSYVVNVPLAVYARVGDLDDGPGGVTLASWIAYGPPNGTTMQSLDVVAPVAADPDPAYQQYGRELTPDAIGEWDVQVTGVDPSGATDVEHLPITVVADHAPCLAQWDPTATPVAGTTVPLSDPTLFQVLVVADDLDPFPTAGGGSFSGTTAFHWSIVPPGGSRQNLTGVTGSGVALDPDSYTPGDIVELRVEIEDRNHTAVNCPATDLTCSVISDQSCLQRMSWRVEVR